MGRGRVVLLLFIYFSLMRIRLDSLVPRAPEVFPPGTQPCGPSFSPGHEAWGSSWDPQNAVGPRQALEGERSHTGKLLGHSSCVGYDGESSGCQALGLLARKRAPRLVIPRVLLHATCPGTDSTQHPSSTVLTGRSREMEPC